MRRAFWIWNIKNTEKGDPLAIAAVAHRAGLTDVFIKVADGGYRFNVTNGVDLVPGVVQALRAVGVRVWGWQYCYGLYPETEEKVATQRIKELKLDGYIVDAETEFKKPGFDKKAETYLSLLKQHNPGVQIAFSSFRFPSYHPEFPWAVFYKYCDVNMPQVYWLQAHNAGAQTEKCFAEFEKMGRDTSRQIPIVPAGPAWKENGWRPTSLELKDFEAVSEKHNAKLVSYWDWEQCRRDLPELWPADVVTPPSPPTPPPPPPALDPQDSRLGRLELKIGDLETALAGLTKVIAELSAMVRNTNG